MIRWAFLFVFCFIAAFILFINDTVEAQEVDLSSPYILADLRYEDYSDFSRIILASNDRINFVSYELQDPYRIVIDVIGVFFCELVEHADYDKGRVKSIDIAKMPYARHPKGLDKFFYAIDYIIITPEPGMPYTVSRKEGGKVIVIDIRDKAPIVQKVPKAQKEALRKRLIKEEIPEKAARLSKEMDFYELDRAKELIESKKEKKKEEPAVVDYLHYEVLNGEADVTIISNKDVEFKVSERYFPNFAIVLEPKSEVFTDLQEKVDLNAGPAKSLHIMKDRVAWVPPALDKYYYPIKSIVIEADKLLSYETSSSKEGNTWVIRIRPTEPDRAAPRAAGTERGGNNMIKAEPIAEPSDTITIDYIHCERFDELSVVTIASNRQLGFKVSERKFPNFGIVLKPEWIAFTDLEEKVEFKDGFIKSLRVIRDRTMRTPAGLDRYFYPVKYIVIETTDKLPFNLYSNEEANTLSVQITHPKIEAKLSVEELLQEKTPRLKPEEEKALKRVMEQFKEDVETEQDRSRKEKAAEMADKIGKELLKDIIIKGESLLDLHTAQEIAIEHSPEANVAREEISVARSKKKEAMRDLLPDVKIKGSHTKGDVLGIDFIEKVYGVEAEQPVFQGGRLLNAYKQSKVNVQVAEAKYKKAETDLDFKVAEAYYDAVTAVMNIRLQKKLLKDAENIYNTAKDRYKDGLSTELEILNVKSQYNQIQFQIASAERDLALARFKLHQAMNLDIANGTDEVDIDQINTELEFKALDIDLYKCLDTAFNTQPDIIVNRLLLESKEYGEKIAKGKDTFKIDVTGFYGKSGSHFETESESLDKDWNIGVKISKPFWGSTASYSFTREETNRKVGQTDRTGSTANSGEFAILDNMSVGTEIIEARAEKKRSEKDLIEARREVAMEVKEAYYSYQESIIQVKNSLEKVKFQEEAVKVAKAQAELNEALQSQLLEAMVKLADERSVYIKALSDFNLSLAKLNKAVGIRDYFNIEQ